MLSLFSNLLFASAALAASSSRLGDRPARRGENRQSQSISHVESRASNTSNIKHSNFWAGTLVSKDSGTFDNVIGTFTIPTPSGGSNSGFTISLGIDGFTCPNDFQAGIEAKFIDGVASYSAWCQWLPEYPSQDISSITINGGDVITVSVIAPFKNYGIVVIVNQTTGQLVRKYIGPLQNPLCGKDAVWIVGVVFEGKTSVETLPLTNFNNVTFTDAIATGPSATDSSISDSDYNPLDATTILDIVQNNTIFTFVTTGTDSLLVEYLSG